MMQSVCNIIVINVYLHRVQFYKPNVFSIQMPILFKLILPWDRAKAAVHSSDGWKGRGVQIKVNWHGAGGLLEVVCVNVVHHTW